MNSYITCPICFKQFKKITNNHLKLHNISYVNFRNQYPNHPIQTDDVTIKNKENCKKRDCTNYVRTKAILVKQTYNLNPKICKYCSTIIPYKSRRNNFCNNSCSASYTNTGRILTTATKTKISNTHKSKERKERIITNTQFIKISIKIAITEADKNNIPYSKLYKCCCTHCSNVTLIKNKQKYCYNCASLYFDGMRQIYRFKFNVYDYPNIFDLNLIKSVGWFSNGGKFGNKTLNPTGLSRDHKISVKDAVKHNYDPYYISHPLNCEIMSQTNNNIKKTKSSITYESLVFMVDEYENVYRGE
jgi:hypothetical protein